MSVFGPNQVEELIIGSALASETTAPTFISGASDTEVAVIGANGAASAAGLDFKLLQKTGGSAAKGLNYEFSDVIEPGEVESMSTFAYAAETAKVQVVSGFTSIVASTVYEVFVRIYNDGGTLSPENFRHVTGSYVTGAVAEGTTTVIDGIAAALNKSLLKEGSGLIAVTKNSTTITVTGVIQDVVPGKDIGRPIEFDVEVRTSKIGTAGVNTRLLSIATSAEAYAGIGTGKYAVNLEWFTKGYKYEHYREASYPSNFDTPYYASSAAGYSVIHIKYKKQRKYTSVENQHKVLTILTVNATKNLAGAAASNAVLAKLNTATGLSVSALATS